MASPLERHRTSPDECAPGDYLREEDCPEWRSEVDSVRFHPGREPGAADPFDEATYKMEVPEDWVFEPRTVVDPAGRRQRVWTRVS